ncbi:hypothetical protein pb186bvf_015581 [Paramecium bursaria]
MMSVEEIKKLPILVLYHQILKLSSKYPSKNKFQLQIAIKESFRDNAKITDQKLIEQSIKIAQMGLRNLQLYTMKNEEMKHNYVLKDELNIESMNPKDKKFIYF